MAGYTRQSSFTNGSVIDATDFEAEFNALESAFNGSTGHTHDGTAGNGPPIESIGPSNDLVITAAVTRPKTNNIMDLGTSAIQFKDGFFDGTLRTDLLTVDETSTFTGLVTAEGNVQIDGNLTVDGDTTISGNLTFGDNSLDSVSFAADINSNLIPNTDDLYDIGTTTKQWRNLYIDGSAEIDDLTADNADINGGTLDGVVIGGSAPAAITGTTVVAEQGFTGNVTGNVTGSSGSTTGNAATATKLATARTITLGGDASGNITFDGSANKTLTVTVANDSHTHDGRYYTETESNSRFVRTGAASTITSGSLRFNDNIELALGTGADAEFFVNGSHLYLDLNSGIGNFYIRDGSTTRYTFDDNGSFTATGNITAYSDQRLKSDIVTIPDALDKVKALRGVNFTKDGEASTGVIAQEVQEVIPEVINDSGEYLAVAYGNLVGVLIEAVKELSEEVEALKAK